MTSPKKVMYVVLEMDSVDEADSLADYLRNHDVEATATGTEVTCPVTKASIVRLINDLRRNWRRYWKCTTKALLSG